MFTTNGQLLTQAQAMYLEELLQKRRQRMVIARPRPGQVFAIMPTPVAQEIDNELRRMIDQAHLLERSFRAPAVPRG